MTLLDELNEQYVGVCCVHHNHPERGVGVIRYVSDEIIDGTVRAAVEWPNHDPSWPLLTDLTEARQA